VHRLLVQQQQGGGADVAALCPAVSATRAGSAVGAAEGAGTLERSSAAGAAERAAPVTTAAGEGVFCEGVVAAAVLAGVVLADVRPVVVPAMGSVVVVWLVVAGHESS
jgi:hypothetical protein